MSALKEPSRRPARKVVSVAAVDEVRAFSSEAATRSSAIARLERAAADGRLQLDPAIRRSMARIASQAALFSRLTHERAEAL